MGCFLRISLVGQVQTVPRTGHASHTFVTTHQRVNSLVRNCFLRISPSKMLAIPMPRHPTVYLSADSVQALSGAFLYPRFIN